MERAETFDPGGRIDPLPSWISSEFIFFCDTYDLIPVWLNGYWALIDQNPWFSALNWLVGDMRDSKRTLLRGNTLEDALPRLAAGLRRFSHVPKPMNLLPKSREEWLLMAKARAHFEHAPKNSWLDQERSLPAWIADNQQLAIAHPDGRIEKNPEPEALARLDLILRDPQ